MTLPSRLACNLRLLLLTSSIWASNALALDFGLCITPVGTYGVIPCDIGCSGAAIASKSSEMVSTYTDYASKFVKTSGTLAQCVAADISGSMKYHRTIDSESRAIAKEVQNHSVRLNDDLAGAAIAAHHLSKVYLKLVSDMSLSLQNHLAVVGHAFVKLSAHMEDQDREISAPGTMNMLESLAETKSVITETEARKEMNKKLFYFSEKLEAESSSGNRQQMASVKNDLSQKRAEWLWRDFGRALGTTPLAAFKIPSNQGSNNELLASYLILVNSNNAERLVMAGAFR